MKLQLISICVTETLQIPDDDDDDDNGKSKIAFVYVINELWTVQTTIKDIFVRLRSWRIDGFLFQLCYV